MRPTTNTDNRSSSRVRFPRDGMAVDLPTPEMLEQGMRRGRRMRAQAAADIAGGLASAVRRLFRSTAPDAGAAEPQGEALLYDRLADSLTSPLTAIRSSAEILRDNPDIDESERARFLQAVLTEEARLEALVKRLLGDSRVEGKAREWRVRLQDISSRRRHQPRRAAALPAFATVSRRHSAS